MADNAAIDNTNSDLAYAQNGQVDDQLSDLEGAGSSLGYNRAYYPPHHDDNLDHHEKPKPVYERCASGCTCDGSLSIVAAYYGI